jgi:zinc D-Ala-D-Ala dipeptidase
MNTDDTDRRRYWTEQFDAACQFMFEAVLPYPVAECGESLVSLQEAAAVANVTVQFSERPHVNGLPRLYVLRDGQIPGFIGAAAEMNERGWILRVEDGYRTPEMQQVLGRTPMVFDAVLKSVMWELDGERPTIHGAVQRDPQTNQVTPLPRPEQPLNSVDEIRAEIDAALARLG